MGYRHDRAAFVDAAVDHVVRTSFDQLTFGKLAAAMGIADRTIVYYFPWKAKLVEAVAEQIVLSFLDHVDDPASDAAPATTGPYLEVVGRAAAGGEPYGSVVRRLRSEWVGSGGDREALARLEAGLMSDRLDPSDP